MSKPPGLRSKGGTTLPARWSAGGLRARLLLAIALPALVGGLVASLIPWPELQWSAFAITALVTVVGAWLWLAWTVTWRLERVARVLEPGGDTRLLVPGGGLSALLEQVSAVRTRERDLEHGVERFEIVRAALHDLALSASEWAETERAPAFDTSRMPEELAPLVARLELAARRLEERALAARAVASQVRETVSDARTRAATLAATAERQFVEAASLLTVLRGLERSSGELAQGVAGLAMALAAGTAETEAARNASEAWERGGAAQLDALERSTARQRAASQDLARVDEEAQVAALESAHAALAFGELANEDRVRLTEALTMLVRATRAARTRARELEERSQADLARAHEEFGGLRALGVAEAGQSARAARTGDPAPAPSRALERLHEAVKEAIARSEKLVRQSERTSSDARRAGEGVAAAVNEVDGLAERFAEAAPAAGDAAPAPPRAMAADATSQDQVPRAPGESANDPASGLLRPLRVLGPEDLLDDDETWSHG